MTQVYLAHYPSEGAEPVPCAQLLTPPSLACAATCRRRATTQATQRAEATSRWNWEYDVRFVVSPFNVLAGTRAMRACTYCARSVSCGCVENHASSNPGNDCRIRASFSNIVTMP